MGSSVGSLSGRGTAFAVAALIALSAGPTSFASFTGSTANPSEQLATLSLAAPADQTTPASRPAGGVDLSWTASPTTARTVSYYVLRRPSGSGAYAQVAGPLSGLVYQDVPGADGSYDYVIRSSVSSFTADGVARTGISDRTPPAAASAVSSRVGAWGSRTVNVSWTAGTDSGTGVAGYTLYHVTVASPLSSCPAAGPASYPDAWSIGPVTTDSASVGSSLTWHCFYLVTIDGAGNTSAPSNVTGPMLSG